MENTSKKITETIIDGLRTVATELEEFQLQFALGKADASDKYEELKKESKESFIICKILR